MKTVKEVSALTGVSVRTLHYYDRIGLLKPTLVTESGYRQYDEAAVERLRWIGLYQEIGFSLKQIDKILDAEDATRFTKAWGNVKDPCYSSCFSRKKANYALRTGK